jgi:hypothetical protein
MVGQVVGLALGVHAHMRQSSLKVLLFALLIEQSLADVSR